ncbi:sensor histidine kinase [Marivirga sp.]|uniref:sensor histidine kinase n=1 Tax=Marivirga sp. TaxID=2018662 RepID=UPI002D7E6AC1|nr:ATP-binding protein [Marivirga sp.]HET8859621.1 ATP-binding protein [Marivirga sp.]
MDGSKEVIIFTLALGASGMLTLAVGIVLFIFFYQRKLLKRKVAFQLIEDLLNQQELKNAYALLEGQELERQRVSKELHDNLGSLLVTANLSLDSFPKEDLAPAQLKKLKMLDELIQKAADETRKLSHSLDSGLLKHFGLEVSLKDLEQTLNDNTKLQSVFEIQLSGTTSNEVNTHIFRMVQELVNNTLKHAQAKNIRLEVFELKDKYVNIIYEDDGLGFDMQNTDSKKGIGIQNIEKRVSQLNGKLTLDTAPNQGLAVIIEIPLNE